MESMSVDQILIKWLVLDIGLHHRGLNAFLHDFSSACCTAASFLAVMLDIILEKNVLLV